MLQMLAELTKGWFFEPMEKFKDFFYNGEEVAKLIELGGCVEFGSTNGQTFTIYDTVENRKHIRYECCFTTIFDIPVIQNVYGDNGKLYEYDFDKCYDELEAVAALDF